MAGGKVIDHEAGALEFGRAVRRHGGEGLALHNPRRAFPQHAMQGRRPRPFFRREVDVARGEGEPVRLAHGRNADDVEAKVEIGRHPGHDLELLIVLLAEDRHVRTHLGEQLGDHGGDAAEKVRPELVFEPGDGGPFRRHPRRESRRVHDLGLRRPDEVDAGRAQRREVGLERAGIAAEVLVRSKLGRIDEDRNDHPARLGLRKTHERQMACVQRTHRGDEGDPSHLGPIAGGHAVELGEGARDDWLARHREPFWWPPVRTVVCPSHALFVIKH